MNEGSKALDRVVAVANGSATYNEVEFNADVGIIRSVLANSLQLEKAYSALGEDSKRIYAQADQQAKILSIIKEKIIYPNSPIRNWFDQYATYEDYINRPHGVTGRQLSKEEFNIIKAFFASLD